MTKSELRRLIRSEEPFEIAPSAYGNRYACSLGKRNADGVLIEIVPLDPGTAKNSASVKSLVHWINECQRRMFQYAEIDAALIGRD